jgi:type I restriction enzyme S subunit
MKYRLGDICMITKDEKAIVKAVPDELAMVALGEANKTHNEFQFDAEAVITPLVSSTDHGHASRKSVKYQQGKFALGSMLCAS